MKEEDVGTEQLLHELAELRQRIAELEALVTDRERAEEELRKERDKAWETLDIAGVILVALNNKGEVTLINENGSKILGYGQREIIGKGWFDNFLPARIRDEARSVFQRLMAEEVEPVVYYENPVLTKCGEERIIVWHNTVLRDEAGHIIGTLSSGEDATERVQMERRLREGEEQYRSIFESTTDAVLIFNLDGMIVEANPIAYKLYGYDEGELIGLPVKEIVHPDYFHGLVNFKRQIKDGGRFETDSVNLRKDGSAFDIEMHGAGFTYRGEPHLLSVVRDISERVEAERMLQATTRKIERLHGVARRLEACNEEEEVYQVAVTAAEEILDFSLCFLDIVEGDKLVVKATSSQVPPEASRETNLEKGGLAAKTYRTGETTVFGNLDDVPEAKPTSKDFKSGISAPIGDIGVFQVVSTEANAFSEDDGRLLELLLGHTAEAIKRIRLQNELKEQAVRDPLTGVYNRRYFTQVIEQEIERSKRYNHPIGFLIIDVNRFKEINDRFGHQRGDKVLQEVACILQEQIRDVDIVIRYGGDEFLIVLLETSGETEAVAQRIRQAVEKRNETNPLVEFPLTFAIGVSCWHPEEVRSLEAVLQKADQQMYEDKRKPLSSS